MGYIEENLVPGETVLAKAKLHWGGFVWPLTNVALGFLLVILPLASDDLAALSCIGWILFLAGLLVTARTAVSFFTTEFGLTDRRVIAKTGALRRESIEILLGKVESISVKQPIVGRLLGYGTIVVVGTGGTKQKFPNIADPMELRRRVHSQIADATPS